MRLFCILQILLISSVSLSTPASPLLGGVTHIAAGRGTTYATIPSGAEFWGIVDYNQFVSNPKLLPGLSGPVAAISDGCAVVANNVQCFSGPVPASTSGLSGASSISAVRSTACALVGGAAKCWGSNSYGQLGNGNTTDSLLPATVMGLGSGTTAISMNDGLGHGHVCAVVGSSVKCWGYNGDGELGNGSTVDSNVPVQVQGLTSTVLSVAAGVDHTCVLVSGGVVRCWGSNTYGQLGNLNASNPALTSVAVQSLSGAATAVVAGDQFTCAIVSTGSCGSGLLSKAVQCWGSNSAGQLGTFGFSSGTSTPQTVCPLSNVVEIAAGGSHACALINDGSMRCWGDNHDGELGNGRTLFSLSGVDVLGIAGAVDIAAAGNEFHTCIAESNGSAYCWGKNDFNALGDGLDSDTATPFAVLNSAGTAPLAGVTAISATATTTCAIVNHAVQCWGSALDFYSLGALDAQNNPVVYSPYPVTVSGLGSGVSLLSKSGAGFNYCASGTAGTKCWGSDSDGQLGDGSTASPTSPVGVTGLGAGPTGLAAGSKHTCAIVAGVAKCFGDDSLDQVGVAASGSVPNDIFTPTAVDLLTGNATAIAAGYTHSCAIVNGAAFCWGTNYNGELGDDGLLKSSSPHLAVPVTGLNSGVSAIAIAGVGSDNRTCAIQNGEIWCWGGEELGLGSPFASPPSKVPGVSGATQIALNNDGGCAIVSAGRVKCWGGNVEGELGNGDLLFSAVPVAVILADDIFAGNFE
jgi:alpha-tubulin suppressor-like RCC1 family protein